MHHLVMESIECVTIKIALGLNTSNKVTMDNSLKELHG